MVQRIGIRELIEFTLRSGDLVVQSRSNHTALEGARIHRKLQKQAGPDYQKEISLNYETTLDGQDVKIEGRADGVVIDPDTHGILVDEIKTAETDFADLTQDALTRYWGQAKFYAWLLAEKETVDHVTVQLTYFQTTTEIVTREQQTWTHDDLGKFVQDVLKEYEFWLHLRSQWLLERNEAAEKLNFPYADFRAGQRKFSGVVYKTIAAQKILLTEAPTGAGKTIATLFPTIKSFVDNKVNRIFYLTAKTSTRAVAEATLKDLRAHNAKIKSVTLTAKEKITFPIPEGYPAGHSPYTDGYYDRIKPALKDLIAHEDNWDRSTIEQYAQKHTVDPFEFSLDASRFADVIIGDYNYLFDPQSYLLRFFANPQIGNVFLIDEAHNLVSRSREMYSTELTQAPLHALDKAIRGQKTQVIADLRKALKPIKANFKKLPTLLPEPELAEQPIADLEDDFVNDFYRGQELLRDWLGKNIDQPVHEAVLNYFFELTSWLRIYDFYGDNYQTIVKTKPTLTLALRCLDASQYLQESLHKGDAAILFSATLSPLTYYQETLTAADPDALIFRMSSPFPPQNQCLLITNYIQTTYAQRDANLPKIISALQKMIAAKVGNYLVFLPSYHYLTEVATEFSAKNPDINVIQQDSHNDTITRQDFLAQFSADNTATLVGFAVLGGSFAEGIDLKGDRLIGVAIISVGLPGLSLENNLIKDYYQAKNHQGFAYAYQLPGFNNVMQAGGRLIRDATDRGVILLLDQRFASTRYQRLFPPHWQQQHQVRSADELTQQLRLFWKN
ncbi:ATP-dependent DNA helicase [Lapidilactobacillus bayanensis]|uniref:ATP-dependent DNA helicase n=1 Tax=Lapidilactobacillus bayanensis TaxID=2485998 RepID=UPI000F766B7D|nr:ATP-dependent DNA helicase [Lapidilactobacillus bayanensis]